MSDRPSVLAGERIVPQEVEAAAESATEMRFVMGNEAIARGALEAGVRVVAGYPGTPASATVGYSCRRVARVRVPTASARTFPARMCGRTTGRFSKTKWTCPASRSSTDWLLPL